MSEGNSPTLSDREQLYPRQYSPLQKTIHWIIGAKPEEQVPTVTSLDYVRSLGGDPKGKVKKYFTGLFPFLQWLPHYNLTWAVGDLIAGITVGMVLVPQSMSYAILANLSAEYGLYSSFIGVFIYAFFATSKDVSIGPVAVMSLETGLIVNEVLADHPGKWAAPVIATALAFMCGFIVLGIGLLRLGWIVEFIPVPAVAGFMTGSAINIAVGQVPALLGISKRFNTKAASYKVVINILKNLKFSTLDAAFGIPALFGLYLVKWVCAWGEKRFPKYKKVFFFVSVSKNAFTVILYTGISYAITHHHKSSSYPISILKTVPSGFKHTGRPYITLELIQAIATKLPVATIILLLEHISISKSFGRINGYKIDPNQELIAIGVTNTIGTLFNAYPATGSFSRSALKSKSGVRTPAAGWPTGVVVLIAIYALTGTFYYIPLATLSAIIIHAVADLVVSPRGAYKFFAISPIEWAIFSIDVIIVVFSSIENGIYFSLCASAALLLFRVAQPGGSFLGRVKVRVGTAEEEKRTGVKNTRDVYVAIQAGGKTTKGNFKIEDTPGVVIYRFEESLVYPNASYYSDVLVDHIKATTRSGELSISIKPGDRPWNHPGPNRWTKAGRAQIALEKARAEGQVDAGQLPPLLKGVVLDFHSVSALDTTGVQNLVDLRNEIERYTRSPVAFHFAGIISPWVKRALIAGNFGVVRREGTIHEVADVVAPMDTINVIDPNEEDLDRDYSATKGPKESDEESLASLDESLFNINTPFFHFDLEEAVRAASAAR